MFFGVFFFPDQSSIYMPRQLSYFLPSRHLFYLATCFPSGVNRYFFILYLLSTRNVNGTIPGVGNATVSQSDEDLTLMECVPRDTLPCLTQPLCWAVASTIQL